jgi:molybdopterin converting factor small subunit
MTKVRINGPSMPSELKEVELVFSVIDLEDLLFKLMEFRPESKAILLSKNKLRSDINILVNGRHCMFLDGLKTKVAPKDIIDIILPVIGG